MTGHGPSAAELFRVSLLDQGGPPSAGRARWRPRAAAALVCRPAPAAPTRSARSNAEADSLSRKQPDQSEHQDQADTDQARPSHPTSPHFATTGLHSRRQAHMSGSRVGNAQAGTGARAVTNGRSVAEAGGGLLETHVTGARSADPPPWLTFGGAGQNWDASDRAATVTLSNFALRQGGCSRTRVRARRPPRYHRHRGPDQGFPRPDHPARCPG